MILSEWEPKGSDIKAGVIHDGHTLSPGGVRARSGARVDLLVTRRPCPAQATRRRLSRPGLWALSRTWDGGQ